MYIYIYIYTYYYVAGPVYMFICHTIIQFTCYISYCSLNPNPPAPERRSWPII